MRAIAWLGLWLCAGPVFASGAIPPPLQHDLKVSVYPGERSLLVTDRIVLPDAMTALKLDLHAGLNPRFYADRGEVELLSTPPIASHVERYELKLPEGTKQIRFGQKPTCTVFCS